MESSDTQALNRDNIASNELPRPPGHFKQKPGPALQYGRSGAGGKPMGKFIAIGITILIVALLAIMGIVVGVSFGKADVPQFTVERLGISKFDVDNNFDDEIVVLSTDLDFHMTYDNKNNGIIGTKFVGMVMEVSWETYNVHLGQTTIPVLETKLGGATKMEISAHGETKILKKTLEKEEMELDLAFSGDVVFSYGLFKSKSYPFTVTCHDISTISSDVACSSKLYLDSAPLPPPRKSPPPARSPDQPPANEENQNATTPNQAPSLSPIPAPTPVIKSGPPVSLVIQDKDVVMDNGILQITIAKPGGFVTNMKYNGINNLLEFRNPEDDRGYWDVVWGPPGTKGTKGDFVRVVATVFRVILEKEDQVELSFVRTYDPTIKGKLNVPLEIDQRYIMLRGEAGLHAYAIMERKNWPGCNLPNTRLAFKLDKEKFRYVVISDTRQRKMPLPDDRLPDRGQELDYKEAVLLVNPVDAEFKGEVDDKYQYSDESQNIKVHGWIANDPPTGFWQITPSYEFRTGGPNKQFLTSHVGPSTLAMFVSAHYSGEELIPKFEDGETWKKVYGPIFMYVNMVKNGENTSLLWEDAKKKMQEEANAWPYSFPASDDFPKANQRANVSGRLFVRDRYIDGKDIPAKDAFVGLAAPGEPGSWQRECKGYQFWTTTDADGRFTITHIRPGNYNLFGFVHGFIGDYKYDSPIDLKVGHNIELGDLIFEPPRDGPTLWEIGEPERTAKEFFVPDPNPKYVNKLYVNHTDKFRQYGLWERYAELYPGDDLVYHVNSSDYHKDWFFAQVTRKIGNRYNGTTWQVNFNMESVDAQAVYKLRLALASATNSDLEVRINKPKPAPPVFVSGRIGNDNSIARHGIHGLYWLFNVDIQGNNLKVGENILYLTQTKGVSQFQGIMYDYIRLEGPPTHSPN